MTSARGFVLALAIFLQSCATVERYVPSGAGVTQESYVGDITLRIALHAGAEMEIGARQLDVHPEPYKQIGLRMSLRVPEGVSVQLLAPDIKLESPEWAQPRILRIALIADWTTADAAGRVLAPTALIQGSARRNAHPGLGLSFVRAGTPSKTLIPVAESFEVHPPAMLVNGKSIAPAPVRFTAETKRLWRFLP